jgi:hypothetical protein
VYRVKIRNGNGTAECRVIDSGSIPEFEVARPAPPTPPRPIPGGH